MLLWLVAIGFFMQTLDSTIVNTALPAMAKSLGESPLRMQSVIIAYSLAMATLIPASGWLADRFGTRRVYLAALALFTAGSLWCAMAPTLSWLTAARALQGAGGAMLLPVGRLAVLRAFPRERFLPAMAFVAVPGLIGPLLGPTVGGWLVEYASWHWIFLINLPIGVAGCLATMALMPDFRASEVERFDFSGYLLLAASMVSISLAFDGMADMRMAQAVVLVLVLFGLVCLAAYWLRAARQPAPLFPPALFQIASFRVGTLGNLFARIGNSSMPFLIPLLLQVRLGYSALHAGLMMIPVAIGGMLVKRAAPYLVGRWGYRKVLIANTVLVGLLIASFALYSRAMPFWLAIVQLALFGALNSLQFSAMNAVTLKDLHGPLASSGNGLHSMVQMLSMSLGVAAAGGLLATFSRMLEQAPAGAISPAFQASFVCMGVITACSAWIFWQLPADEVPPKTPAPAGDAELA